MAERAVLLAGAAAAAGVFALARIATSAAVLMQARSLWRAAAHSAVHWRSVLLTAGADGRLPVDAGRKINGCSCLAAAVCGYALLGSAGALLGAVAGAPAVSMLIRARRARYARRVDDGAADLARALASALAAGHSVRGALLAAGRTLPQPISGELTHVAVDLTLGLSIEDTLAGLRGRTASRRLESLAGAIELHRRSGGDLARLMRELDAAFRGRDAALRDARAATAQARFTALLVGAMPLAASVLAELASPGSVSGVFSYAPTAALLLCALALFAAGSLLCLRASRV
jgi:tight adherence protein B